jgi:hypothetical protein
MISVMASGGVLDEEGLQKMSQDHYAKSRDAHVQVDHRWLIQRRVVRIPQIPHALSLTVGQRLEAQLGLPDPSIVVNSGSGIHASVRSISHRLGGQTNGVRNDSEESVSAPPKIGKANRRIEDRDRAACRASDRSIHPALIAMTTHVTVLEESYWNGPFFFPAAVAITVNAPYYSSDWEFDGSGHPCGPLS